MFSVFSVFFLWFSVDKGGNMGRGSYVFLVVFWRQIQINNIRNLGLAIVHTKLISQVSRASCGVSSWGSTRASTSFRYFIIEKINPYVLASGFWRLGLEVVLQLPASDCFREKLFHILSQNTVQNIILLLDFALIFLFLC